MSTEKQPDPFGDYLRKQAEGKTGIFRDHSCWKCKDGTDLSKCPTPHTPGNCGYPHARDD